MARVKNVEAYCNFCNEITKMEIQGEVQNIEDENKRWAKCKKCKHTMRIDLSEDIKQSKPDLEGIEENETTEYSPKKAFEVGDTIYHKGWDDFGKVIAKETLSNGQKSIAVEFQKSGSKKLIEQLN